MIASMESVVKRYGDVTALDHVNLDISEGEILGLLGPNGAGKTTAIRVLCGLIPADSGRVTMFGENQTVTNLNTRRQMGLVTQEITVFTDLTAAENLRYFGGLHGLRGAELAANVKAVLEFVGLTEHAKKYPKKFSGGMQRRLNIACALVHKPKFLIMDEPTVGIDPQSRNHILESVKKIARQGTTVLYTSHYMEEVQAICDRISIMDAGRVIAEGTLGELVGRIQHEDKTLFTAVQSSDELTEELKAISGVKGVTASGNAYEIVSTAGSGNLNRIIEIAQRHGGVTDVSVVKPTLEDVFLTLTGKSLRDGGDNGVM
ncbi:ABC transporter ATP-binding protein [Eubacteriales bacterium OttesenSCG-928-N13]|nr:ABC transporter ATP-binding protein [Eubacteriales bacterium OttesenSCG-928-N13]